MRILSKLATAFRGGVRETAEVVIDANSMRIFAQEIHECENHITQSKQHLANIIAEKMQIERELVATRQSIKKHEKCLTGYLDDNNETAALGTAQLISDKEPVLERQQQHLQQLAKHEEQLQQTLKKMLGRLDEFCAEYRMAKATSSLQSAQGKLANQNQGVASCFGDMQDSLTRIRNHQQQFSDQMNAMDKIDVYLEGDASREELQQQSSAKSVLDRLRRTAVAS